MRHVVLAVSLALVLTDGVAADAAAQATAAENFPVLEQLLKDRKLDEALVAAQSVTHTSPNSAHAFFLLGRTLFYKERDDAARAAFDKALALRPNFAEANFFRGLTFNYGPDPEQARSDFESAARLQPDEAKYWFELGKLNQKAGKHTVARQNFDKALQHDPTHASAMFYLGGLASDRGEHALAAQLWERSLALKPDSIETRLNLGQYHQSYGDPKKSLEHYLAVAAIEPDDVNVLKKVMQAYYRLGDLEAAQPYRRTLLDVIASSKDSETRAIQEFCFDQFDVANGRFYVYETVAKEGPLFYWYTFKLVDKHGAVIKTINLESSAVLKDMDTVFMLGQNEGPVHITYGVAFKSLPEYLELKKLVLQANEGKLKPAASSTRG